MAKKDFENKLSDLGTKAAFTLAMAAALAIPVNAENVENPTPTPDPAPEPAPVADTTPDPAPSVSTPVEAANYNNAVEKSNSNTVIQNTATDNANAATAGSNTSSDGSTGGNEQGGNAGTGSSDGSSEGGDSNTDDSADTDNKSNADKIVENEKGTDGALVDPGLGDKPTAPEFTGDDSMDADDYNEAVGDYNDKVDDYNKEVDDYNKEVDDYNDAADKVQDQLNKEYQEKYNKYLEDKAAFDAMKAVGETLKNSEPGSPAYKKALEQMGGYEQYQEYLEALEVYNQTVEQNNAAQDEYNGKKDAVDTVNGALDNGTTNTQEYQDALKTLAGYVEYEGYLAELETYNQNKAMYDTAKAEYDTLKALVETVNKGEGETDEQKAAYEAALEQLGKYDDYADHMTALEEYENKMAEHLAAVETFEAKQAVVNTLKTSDPESDAYKAALELLAKYEDYQQYLAELKTHNDKVATDNAAQNEYNDKKAAVDTITDALNKGTTDTQEYQDALKTLAGYVEYEGYLAELETYNQNKAKYDAAKAEYDTLKALVETVNKGEGETDEQKAAYEAALEQLGKYDDYADHMTALEEYESEMAKYQAAVDLFKEKQAVVNTLKTSTPGTPAYEEALKELAKYKEYEQYLADLKAYNDKKAEIEAADQLVADKQAAVDAFKELVNGDPNSEEYQAALETLNEYDEYKQYVADLKTYNQNKAAFDAAEAEYNALKAAVETVNKGEGKTAEEQAAYAAALEKLGQYEDYQQYLADLETYETKMAEYQTAMNEFLAKQDLITTLNKSAVGSPAYEAALDQLAAYEDYRQYVADLRAHNQQVADDAAAQQAHTEKVNLLNTLLQSEDRESEAYIKALSDLQKKFPDEYARYQKYLADLATYETAAKNYEDYLVASGNYTTENNIYVSVGNYNKDTVDVYNDLVNSWNDALEDDLDTGDLEGLLSVDNIHQEVLAKLDEDTKEKVLSYHALGEELKALKDEAKNLDAVAAELADKRYGLNSPQYTAYLARVQSYNNMVAAYNQKLEAYNAAVQKYNAEVAAYNASRPPKTETNSGIVEGSGTADWGNINFGYFGNHKFDHLDVKYQAASTKGKNEDGTYSEIITGYRVTGVYKDKAAAEANKYQYGLTYDNDGPGNWYSPQNQSLKLNNKAGEEEFVHPSGNGYQQDVWVDPIKGTVSFYVTLEDTEGNTNAITVSMNANAVFAPNSYYKPLDDNEYAVFENFRDGTNKANSLTMVDTDGDGYAESFDISGKSVFVISTLTCDGMRSSDMNADGLDLVLNLQTMIKQHQDTIGNEKTVKYLKYELEKTAHATAPDQVAEVTRPDAPNFTLPEAPTPTAGNAPTLKDLVGPTDPNLTRPNASIDNFNEKEPQGPTLKDPAPHGIQLGNAPTLADPAGPTNPNLTRPTAENPTLSVEDPGQAPRPVGPTAPTPTAGNAPILKDPIRPTDPNLTRPTAKDPTLSVEDPGQAPRAQAPADPILVEVILPELDLDALGEGPSKPSDPYQIQHLAHLKPLTELKEKVIFEIIEPIRTAHVDDPAPQPMVFRLNAQNNLVEIPEEPVPLAAPVVTGDHSGMWLAVALQSLLAMVGINIDKKRKHESF